VLAFRQETPAHRHRRRLARREISRRSDWIHRFSAEKVAEIEGAMRSARERGIGLAVIDKSSSPLL
jgi:hypothetical protein